MTLFGYVGRMITGDELMIWCKMLREQWCYYYMGTRETRVCSLVDFFNGLPAGYVAPDIKKIIECVFYPMFGNSFLFSDKTREVNEGILNDAMKRSVRTSGGSISVVTLVELHRGAAAAAQGDVTPLLVPQKVSLQ